MITNEEFITSLTKSGKKHAIIGICIFIFGAFIIWLALSGVDSSADDMGTGGKIVLWVLALLCVFIGLLLVFKQMKTSSQIKNGKHPLINAINQNDASYLLWVYENVVNVKGGGSNHQVWAVAKGGNRYTIEAKKDKIEGIINYLASKFPQAEVGYSKEIEIEISKQIKANKTIN